MIEDMLIDVAKQGYSPEDIKEAVVEVLQPYFTHKEALKKYACDSQLLSSFEFFVRYYNDDTFSQGIKLVLNCYKNVIKNYNQESWRIILSTYAVMVEDENKMLSIRKKEINLQEDDLYEKMVQIFERIGNVLELSVKHIVQELNAIIYLQNKGNADYEKIRKLNFGVVINNILDQGMLQSLLLVDPSGLKLSDWRNIAYHHTYSLDNNGRINCTYGKDNQNSINMSMQELEGYLHKIVRASNILNIARCIFIFDFNEEIPKNYPLEKAFLRESIKCEQFRIALLSQEFQLGNIILNESRVELDLYDLNLKSDSKSRIIHCSQFLLNTWNVWECDFVCINYFANTGRKICCVYVEGEVCKAIYEEKKDITYLAEKFKIRYF